MSQVDGAGAVKLLRDMIRINSVNPSLVSGAPGEGEIADYLAGYMESCGLETRLEEVAPGRPNVVGVLRGSGGGRTLLLNGHMDTVGVEYMEIDPLDPVVREGRMYGRGAIDMKGGLASLMAAVKAVADRGEELRGDFVITAVCDEEYASIGTERIVEQVKADAAIVGEPTELQILVAHKGFAWIDIETKGRAAHGSAWELGDEGARGPRERLGARNRRHSQDGEGPGGPGEAAGRVPVEKEAPAGGPALHSCLHHPGRAGAEHLPRPLQAPGREEADTWGGKGGRRRGDERPAGFHRLRRPGIRLQLRDHLLQGPDGGLARRGDMPGAERRHSGGNGGGWTPSSSWRGARPQSPSGPRVEAPTQPQSTWSWSRWSTPPRW